MKKTVSQVFLVGAALMLIVSGSAFADVVAPGAITLESTNTDGTQGDGSSYYPSISADGDFIAFESDATTLVDNDINNYKDIFLRDVINGTTQLISVSGSYGAYGYGADYYSERPSISGDGQYVAFESWASNLVPGTTRATQDVFIYDTVTGTTELVSARYGGYGGATYGYGGNNYSYEPSTSFDGQYVAFWSYATDLTADTDSGNDSDVFIRNTQTDTTTRIMAYGGQEPNDNLTDPAIAGDGSAVAFESDATNLMATNNPGSSYDDIFVYDTASGTIELVSRDYTGFGSYGYGAGSNCYNPAISYGGRYVTFYSSASNLIAGDTGGQQQVFVYDRTSGEMYLASAVDGGTAYGNNSSSDPDISPDGRYVAFRSYADNLTAVDDSGGGSGNLIYLRDTVDQTTTLISRIDNTQAGYGAGTYGAAGDNPVVSACGMYVAFDCYEDSLVAGDSNSYGDIFRAINDTDGDGVAESDSDGDGIPDCIDEYPNDADNDGIDDDEEEEGSVSGSSTNAGGGFSSSSSSTCFIDTIGLK